MRPQFLNICSLQTLQREPARSWPMRTRLAAVDRRCEGAGRASGPLGACCSSILRRDVGDEIHKSQNQISRPYTISELTLLGEASLGPMGQPRYGFGNHPVFSAEKRA